MSNERIIEHIRKRKDIEPELWSIRKLLEQYGMGMYAQLCCDRIAEAGKIDGDHVQIDFNEPGRNLAVDYRGFGRCSNIIEGYIGEDEWYKLFDIFYDRQELIDEENNLIRGFRKLSKKELKNMISETKKTKSEETDMVDLWIKEEIKARRLINRIIQKAKELTSYAYVRIKYFRLFDFLKRYECGGVSDE